MVTFHTTPSPHHDAILNLFRERPTLAVELLAGAADVGLSPGEHARLANTTFNDRPSKDFHPDAVITVGPARHPRHAIVVEVQQERGESERRQLPRYAASLWLMLQCPVTVLVICPDDRTAAYFAEPVPTTLPGYTFHVSSDEPCRSRGRAAGRHCLPFISVRRARW